MGTPHSERLQKSLAEVRKELIETVKDIRDDELDWAPREGMKNYRALLQEIGTMEKLCESWLKTGEILPWDMAIYVTGDSLQEAVNDLEMIRSLTIAYLKSASEEKLQTPVAVPEDWQQYWGKEIEPEEAFRWVVMHEYYHLGQIISYRWIQGYDPYKGYVG